MLPDGQHRRYSTRVAGLYLAISELVDVDLPALVAQAGYPGTKVIPAASSILSLLALKLVAMRRVSHGGGSRRRLGMPIQAAVLFKRFQERTERHQVGRNARRRHCQCEAPLTERNLMSSPIGGLTTLRSSSRCSPAPDPPPVAGNQ